MNELDLHREVRRLFQKLEAYGLVVAVDTSRNSGKAPRSRGMNGFSDWMVMAKGPRIGFLELKHPEGGGRLSDEQMNFRTRVQSIGLLWRETSSMEEVSLFLNELGVQCRNS